MPTNPYQPPGTEKCLERSPHRRKQPTKMRATLVVMLIQCLLLYVLVFVNFGFDHPINGLDFDNWLRVAVLYGMTLLVGVALAAWRRQWILLVIQLLPALTLLAML